MTVPIVTSSDTSIRYKSDQALPLLIIDSSKCHAVISLYGGQILEFNAKGKSPLLWLSPTAIFEQGQAIRGGVPICAPWFGPHSGEQEPGVKYPNHGFARTSLWQQSACKTTEDDDIQISLELTSNELTNKIYPHPFLMQLHFTLSDTLTIEFSIENNAQQPIDCEWALHSYFTVDDIKATTVTGLDNLSYIDKTRDNQRATLTGDLTFNQEVDRCFVKGSATQTINATNPITVTGSHCDSVITWNPGEPLSGKLIDIGTKYYHQFVCVERGAAFENKWLIAPNQQQRATMILSN